MSLAAVLAKRRLRSLSRTRTRTEITAEARLRGMIEGLDRLASARAAALRDVTVTPITERSYTGELVAAAGARADRAVLLLHGGGYVWGRAQHFRDVAGLLSRYTRARVLVLEYPLAPQHRYPRQLEAAGEAYADLLARGVAGRHVAIVGDSAGGNLALALAQHLVATRPCAERPGALVLFSPWLDLTGSGASMRVNAARDVLLDPAGATFVAGLFAGSIALDDPRVSPLFGDLRELPPTHIQVASDEILLDDAVRVAVRMRRAGGRPELLIFPDLWHDFQQAARVVPEAREALQRASRFVVEHWRDGSRAGDQLP